MIRQALFWVKTFIAIITFISIYTTQGVGFRRSLRKGGYKVYLVNEYNTSCKLYKTGESLVSFRGSRSPLALETLQKGSINDKIKTESQKRTYKSIEIINRDLNGALNILYKGRCILEGKEIPDYMTRKYPILERTN